MSTYSTDLKIELIGDGEQPGTWGDTTNANFSNVFEQALVGRGTVTFTSDSDLTLTLVDSVLSQEARNLYLNVVKLGSLTPGRTLFLPDVKKNYVIENNTTVDIQVTTSSFVPGTPITLPAFTRTPVYSTGQAVFFAFDNLGSLTLAQSLPVSSGGTGSNTPNGAVAGLLPAQGGNEGKVLTTDGTNTSWQPATVGSLNNPGGFTIEQRVGIDSITRLYFSFNGTDVAVLTEAGTFETLSNITAFGDVL